MAARRASTGEIRSSVGEPYQIYSEITNIGKNVKASKKKVRWLIGFTEMDQEIEVVLIHTLSSGKKVILENAREITNVSNIMASDFSHGWRSETTSRIFRIEASIGLTTEHVYTFSVDGVTFVDMNRKPLGNAPKGHAAHGGTDLRSDSQDRREELPSRRGSTGAIPAKPAKSDGFATGAPAAAPRGNFQSPFAGGTAAKRDSFDPFDAPQQTSGSDFDPFGDKQPPAHDPFAKTTPASAPHGGPKKVPSAASSLFGAFDDDASSNTASHNTAAQGSFDPFGSSSTADPFSTTSTPSADPFAAPTTHHKTPTSASSVGAKKLQAPSAKTTPTAELNLLGDFPPATSTATSDPFAATKPARRSSAAEISMDFAGLSFEVAPVQPPPAPVIVPRDVPRVEEAPAAPTVADPWGTGGLVNLDLSGRKALAAKGSAAAPNQPTLDNLLGKPTPANGRRTSHGPTMAPPIAPEPAYQPSNDPFGAPPVLMPTSGAGYGAPMGMAPPPAPIPSYGMGGSSASAISGLGQQPMNPFVAQGGGAYRPAPAPTPYNSGMVSGQPSAMGGNVGRTPYMGTTPYGGGYTASGIPPPNQVQQPPKNSLDSLDWRK